MFTLEITGVGFTLKQVLECKLKVYLFSQLKKEECRCIELININKAKIIIIKKYCNQMYLVGFKG